MPLAPLVATAPPVGWLVVVLVAYTAVLVPVVFWGLGRTGRRNAGWVILPLLAAFAAAGLWLYVHQQVAS